MKVIVKMHTVDQNGNDLSDELTDAAMQVYNKAGELFINDMLIPALNDRIYKDKGFSLESDSQGLYEDAGMDMFATAYKFTAYLGFGQVGNKLVYPMEVPLINEETNECLMKCFVRDLWKEGA